MTGLAAQAEPRQPFEGASGQRLEGLGTELGGVEVYGVEPGPEEAAEAQARGVNVFVGLLEELTLGPGGSAPRFPEAFDQVQMFHVLEHLHEPLAALSHLGSWLRPGGRLILEVPNVTHPYGPLEANFFQNAHLTSFSANTLSAMVHRAGLAPMAAHPWASCSPCRA